MKKDAKWIPGYENMYKITPYGVVYSYKGNDKRPKERATQVQMYDYDIINLSKKGKPTTFLIHQLVMNTFGPARPYPPNSYVITHIDRNKKNNHISNLKWILKKDVKTGKSLPVQATGVDEGDIISFRAVTFAAKYFKTNQQKIRNVIVEKQVYKGYTFKDL